MTVARRTASTRWTGPLATGSGSTALESSRLGEYRVSAGTRFEGPEGCTSPEELIAAAQSSCLAMNLSAVLQDEDLVARQIDVRAAVTVGPNPAGGFAISTIDLLVRAEVDGLERIRFEELLVRAAETCPVSKALSGADIRYQGTLGA